jgi:hypothetical protein
MSIVRAILIACLLLAPGIWFVVSGSGVSAQEAPTAPPFEVTTDTPEYCLYLQGRVNTLVHEAAAPPAREVTDLSADGQRMCDHGQTRGGIMRLRRALMLIMHDNGTAVR